MPRRVRIHLDREMRAGQIPGLQVAVVRGARIRVLGHFGQADVENPTPVTATTLFQIASLTKAFAAVAVLQLADDGALDLRDAVSRHLPDLPAAWRTVTVAQLATHTSGLPDVVADLDRLRLVVDGDEAASWAKVQTLPLQSAPGERLSYNQTNYVLLGRLIERLSGESLASVLRRRQFAVAGMTRTAFGDDRDVVPHSARTYTPYAGVRRPGVRRRRPGPLTPRRAHR